MRVLFVTALVLLAAGSAFAQEEPTAVPPVLEEYLREHYFPSFTHSPFERGRVSLSAALDSVLALQLSMSEAIAVLEAVGDTGDISFAPRLRQVAELFGSGPYMHFYTLTGWALDALWRVGEPEETFYGYLHTWYETPTLASAAAEVLFRAPRPERVPEMLTLAETIRSSDLHPLDRSTMANHLRWYAGALEENARAAALPIEEQLGAVVWSFGGAFYGKGIDEETGEPWLGVNTLEWQNGPRWAVSHIQALARTHPSVVEAFFNGALPESPFEQPVAALIVEALEAEAFPEGLPVPPPTNPDADVRPILECVEAGGDRFVAVFGYNNRSDAPVVVPYGVRNHVTPAAYDRVQPEAFDLPGVVPGQPGRTPPYPGYAWRVTFQPGEQVVWMLGGRTATASGDSAPHCSER